MARATRSGTISRHLTEGGLHDLHLHEATQKAGPDGHEIDGFSTRQERRGDTLFVVAGAFGPNWLRTLAEVTGRLESPHVKCTVVDAPELGGHEVLVRWATSEELQARKAAAARRQAPLTAQLRRQQVEQRSAEERQALEASGQSGLF